MIKASIEWMALGLRKDLEHGDSLWKKLLVEACDGICHSSQRTPYTEQGYPLVSLTAFYF